MLTTSDAGRLRIQNYEALRLTGYLPTAHDVPTIGWGHTGPEVFVGMVIDRPQAEVFFDRDLAPAEAAINEVVKVPVTQDQFDALVTLVFNVGVSGFRHSHLLIAINAGDTAGTRANWLDWDHQGGVELAGLKRRRAEEYALFSGAQESQ